MKKYHVKFLFLLVALAAIASCKKNNGNSTTSTTGTVVGFWGGNGITGGVTQKASILFKSGNTLRFYSMVSAASDTGTLAAANKVDGTYTINGTTVMASYTYLSTPLLLTATADNSFTTMAGSATVSGSSTAIGTFTFTKQ